MAIFTFTHTVNTDRCHIQQLTTPRPTASIDTRQMNADLVVERYVDYMKYRACVA